MSFVIGLLTFILVVDCLLLILLVLMQLPKKEAGLGTAFGGGATDALFGAGTGNVLTVVTKYTAGIFILLSLSLSVMNAHREKSRPFEKELERRDAPGLVPPAPASQERWPAAPAPGSAPVAPKE
jgi:preprotein translocase subunit SecG